VLLAFAAPTTWGQLGAILAGGLAGLWLIAPPALRESPRVRFPIGRHVANAALALFFGLLILLPLARHFVEAPALELVDGFYRSGSLVFGGGHVVLPLLRGEVVPSGWVSDDVFLAGYGAAQAVPGPLFTFAAYLGAVMSRPPSGVGGGALALVAIFAPAFLLVVGALPYWGEWRDKALVRPAMAGINAAVVGILLAALYDPVIASSIASKTDAGIALAAFGMLAYWKLPPLAVVAFSALAGALATFAGAP
jgi:chromate transporter